ncbi:MAG: 16S rRNA (guanine(527)-N(7))-methyltransferase RsmG, partial [Leptolyngbyaceae cyanobacterium RU_5_1]|nr:16S rRNA (guanine(527)-N(7))-methyltransferase RsmG [Leptolyngbyaceae cyanobacterium RU_5_1]
SSILRPPSSILRPPSSVLHPPLPIPASVIDIGTGAGFPGIPIAIVQPTWTLTLLDSTRKKVDFLKHLLATLQLSNAVAVADRVEQIGLHAKYRGRYDLALVRAVGAASVCAEYALPLLKLGGLAVLYRGHWTDQDTAILKPVAELLGGEIERVEGFMTPITRSDRHCLYLRKVAPTPDQYPRTVGIPAQNPL